MTRWYDQAGVVKLGQFLSNDREEVLLSVLHALRDYKWHLTAAELGPALIQFVNDGNDTVRSEAALTLGRVCPVPAGGVEALCKVLQAENASVRKSAAYGLKMWGREAHSAFPALAAAAEDPEGEVRAAAILALGSIATSKEMAQMLSISFEATVPPEKVVPIINRAIGDSDPAVRRCAATALYYCVDPAPESTSALLRAVSDPDASVRCAVVEALGQLGVNGPDALRALLNALDDGEAKVRASAAGSLGRMHMPPEEVTQALMRSMGDENADVREQAILALGAVKEPSKEVQNALQAALDDPEAKVRASAAKALVGCPLPPAEIASTLLQNMVDEDPYVRGQTAFALSRSGHASEEVIDALIVALQDTMPSGEEDKTVGEMAADALQRLGPAAAKAVPALLNVMREDGLSSRAAAAQKTLDKIGFDAAVHYPVLLEILVNCIESDRRAWASSAIQRVGPDNEELVPLLVSALQTEDDEVWCSVSTALRNIGPGAKDAIPRLLEGQSDSHSARNDHASWALRDIRKGTLEQVEYDLHHGSPETRVAALKNLELKGPEAVAAIPLVVEMLRDEDYSVSTQAIHTLGAMGPGAAEAVPALVELMKAKRDYAAEPVLHALAGIGPGAEAAVPAIIEEMRHPFADVWFLGARALGAIGPGAVAGVPELIEGFSNVGPWVTYDTAKEALVRIGPEAVPVLKDTLYGDDTRLAEGAAEVMGLIGRQSDDVVPLLVAVLRDDQLRQSELAAKSLGIVGPRAQAAVPALIEAMKLGAPGSRTMVAEALGPIGPAAMDAAPQLMDELKNSRAESRRVAAYALAEIGQKSDECIAGLLELLHDEDGRVRGTAAYALSTMGEGAVPPLTAALKSADATVRAQAACALGQMGTRAQPSFPELIALSRTDVPTVRLYAVTALAAIAPESNDVRAVLEGACSDKDRFVREQAFAALSRSPESPRNAVQPETPLPGYHLKREELPVEGGNESVRHVKFYLVFDGTGQSVPLAGLIWDTAEDQVLPHRTGFNEETFWLGWLDEGRLLHVAWASIPQGNGSHTHTSHILLAKRGNEWHEVYRDTIYSHGSGGSSGWMSRDHAFTYEADTNLLSIEETESGWSAVSNRIPLSLGHPPDKSTRWSWEHNKRTEWRYRVAEDGCEYVDGRHWIDIVKQPFDVEEIAEYLKPRFTEETIAWLRFLNPSRRDSEAWIGSVLLGFDVAPHKPWGGDNYGSSE
ncbi:MAG: HEAT repeat domain-containing protein [Candidatus Hydrogenedentes bacterium]|nr:HEAT repeat domain-containing protein [Candidatus Hydrogenedentota bacterium]